MNMLLDDSGALVTIHRETVQPEWIDYNGHMNLAYYVLVFDHATDQLFDMVGVGEAYRKETEKSLFVVESHITYDQEVALNAPLRVTTQILDCDEKRLHFFHRMYHEAEGFLAATTELMSLHVDLKSKRAAPFSRDALEKFRAINDAHNALECPKQVGRVMGIRKK